MAECEQVAYRLAASTNADTDEEIKRRLAPDINLFSDVDYQTEVTHRLTDAFLAGRPLSSVDMKSPYRTEKVRTDRLVRVCWLTPFKWSTELKLWRDADWTPQEIVAFENAIKEDGAELRAVREAVRSRTIKEVVRFYGHWKAYVVYLDRSHSASHHCHS